MNIAAIKRDILDRKSHKQLLNREVGQQKQRGKEEQNRKEEGGRDHRTIIEEVSPPWGRSLIWSRSCIVQENVEDRIDNCFEGNGEKEGVAIFCLLSCLFLGFWVGIFFFWSKHFCLLSIKLMHCFSLEAHLEYNLNI